MNASQHPVHTDRPDPPVGEMSVDEMVDWLSRRMAFVWYTTVDGYGATVRYIPGGRRGDARCQVRAEHLRDALAAAVRHVIDEAEAAAEVGIAP